MGAGDGCGFRAVVRAELGSVSEGAERWDADGNVADPAREPEGMGADGMVWGSVGCGSEAME